MGGGGESLVKISELCLLLKRGKSAKYGNSLIQIIKSGQARGYTLFDFSTRHYVDENFVLDERQLQKGDILINSTGVGTAGRVTLFELDGVFVADSHITIFRPNQEKLLPKFGLYSLAHIGFDTIEKMAQGASGQIELNLSTIGNISFPLPNITEQQKIITQIEQYEQEIQKAEMVMSGIAERKKAVLAEYLSL